MTAHATPGTQLNPEKVFTSLSPQVIPLPGLTYPQDLIRRKGGTLSNSTPSIVR